MVSIQVISFLSYIIYHCVHIYYLSFNYNSEGLSRQAPLAFAVCGSYLARLGRIELGSELTVLAQSLTQKLSAHEFAGQIQFLVADIQCCMQPLLAANESRIEGERLALTVGDVHYGCFHRLHHVMTLFWSGLEL